MNSVPLPPFRMLYDSLCPMCSREVSFLKRRNSGNSVIFEDIADPSFDPAIYGLTMYQTIGAMHGITSDGQVLKGVDVFVEVYRRCGLGWLASLLSFKPTRPIFNLGYRIFAKVRPWFSRLDREKCNDRCAVRID